MIPRDYITEWRGRAPWSEDFQVEQDLIISRALVELVPDPVLAGALTSRLSAQHPQCRLGRLVENP